MTEQQKYYRTVVTLEVLSDRPLYDIGLEDVSAIADECIDGDFSGAASGVCDEVDRGEITRLLLAQGSDPEFLLGEEDEDDE